MNKKTYLVNIAYLIDLTDEEYKEFDGELTYVLKKIELNTRTLF